MTRLATIASVLIALLPATAQANTGEETQDLAVASAYWNAEACPAEVVWVESFPDLRMASADLTNCRITIASSIQLQGSALCQVIVHEYGHLLGFDHSADPRSVMSADPLSAALVPGCAEPPKNFCKSKRYKRNHPNKCHRPLGKVE